ncbi:hypothetical protein GBA52_010276 [Prunus armeniaca]|nr:hypothetical protein GBA52_010276 [Prunus armeniaca]
MKTMIKHLKVLKFSKVKVVVPPDSRPSFKVVHVDISYYCEESLQDFYINCLNEHPDEKLNFDVSSESLKALYIKVQSSFNFEDDNDNLDTYSFVTNTPNLESLGIDEDILGTYEMEEMFFLCWSNNSSWVARSKLPQ